MEENQISFRGRVLCHQRVRGPLPSTARGKEYYCYGIMDKWREISCECKVHLEIKVITEN